MLNPEALSAAGREVREQLFDQVKSLLHDLDMGMQPISVLFPYLPTSFHRKRDSCALPQPVITPASAQGHKAHCPFTTSFDPLLLYLFSFCPAYGPKCAAVPPTVPPDASVHCFMRPQWQLDERYCRGRGCRSRKKLLELFSGVIQQRRKSGVKEDDVLQVRV